MREAEGRYAMRPIDIRNYKIELRKLIKQERRELDLTVKAEMDEKIADNVRRLRQYKKCTTLLTYVATPIEVETRGIIKNAIADGKRVAVPRCLPETRGLSFHYINGTDELSPGTFGVLEPDENSKSVTDFTGCLMIVPALMFDIRGYRLGYGMGYYDRCMSHFEGPSAGICYSQNVRYHMPNGRFDRPVDILVTEKWIRSKKEQKKKVFWGDNRNI